MDKAQAGLKALYTCTSWYAYAAMDKGGKGTLPPLSSPLPPGATVPPNPGGGLSLSDGGVTNPDQPLTSTYHAQFMASQLLAVGHPRICDTRFFFCRN